jgi:hypothetical protein
MPLSGRAPEPSAYHANVNGLGPRLEELRVASLGFAFVSLQDTRLGEAAGRRRIAEAWPTHRAYGFHHSEDGPGVSLLVHASFRQREVLRETRHRHRIVAVEVELADGGRPLVVASYYAPPEDANGLLERPLLEAVLDTPRALLLGDLNARSRDLGCRGSNHNGDILAETLDALGAVALNDPQQPTYYSLSYRAFDCLDWALATPSAARILPYCELGGDVGSDHRPLLVSRSRGRRAFRRPPPAAAGPPRWRTSRIADWEPFRSELSRQLAARDVLPPPDLMTPSEVDAAAEAVSAAFQHAADLCLQRSVPRQPGELRLPWNVLCLIKERRRLAARLVRRRNDPAVRAEVNRLRRAVREALDDLRKEQAEARAKLLRAGPRGPTGRDFWPLVRTYFSPAPPPPPPLESGDAPAVEPADRATVFAAHLGAAFGGVTDAAFDAAFFAETERLVGGATELQPLTELPPTATRRGPADEVQPTDPVPPWCVTRRIGRLRRGKAPGPDGVSSDMLKEAPPAVAEVLATIFSAALALGCVPACWRHSVVRLLPKPGRALTRPADFRPISLTSTIGKLLEGIFAERLLRLARRRSLLPPEQSAFQPGRGAVEQVVLLAQRAGQAMNAGLSTTVVGLDVAKAYDTVWHAGLLRQSLDLLPTGCARWIAAFLGGRTASVLEDGAVSPAFPLRTGVPQGSPLSPLLFIFYTASMPVPRGELRGASVYADDVVLWCCGSSPATAWSALRPDLRAIVRWCRRWRLRISAEKTQLACFTRRKPLPPEWTPPVQLEGEPLVWRNRIDVLGVRLDRQLQFYPHARHVSAKAAPRVLALRRVMAWQRRVPAWVGVLLCKVCIRPVLAYAAPALIMANPSARLTLERADRRALRVAARCRLDTPVPQLHQRARLGPLWEELRRLAGVFLLRLAESGNGRLLRAFVPERPQHHFRVRWDLPLERCYACVAADDRGPISEWLRGNVPRPPGAGPGPSRPSRATVHAPELWGRSPLPDAFPPRRGGGLWPWTAAPWTARR